MALSGKKWKLIRRRGDATILVVSLLLAVFIWLAHNLTQDYFAYRQFKVTAVTNIDGYSPASVSECIVSAGGRARGFNLIGRRSSSRYPTEVTIKLDPDLFTPDPSDADMFSIDARDMQKQLDDAVGNDFSVTVMQEGRVSFKFAPQSCKKVPVIVPSVEISCKPQYMCISDVVITPDSVLVYGDAAALDNVVSVTSRPVRVTGADRNVHGELLIGRVPGMRVGNRYVEYDAKVARYVEERVRVELEVTGVPAGKKVILLPSGIDVACRVPFDGHTRISGDDLSFAIEYEDLVSSRSSKLIPRLTSSAYTVYSYETDPPMVDFIIAEDR